MFSKLNIRLALILSFAFMFTFAYSQELSVTEIVDKSYHNYKYLGNDRINIAHLDIKNASSKTTMEREMIVMRRNEKDLNQKWYVYFKKPADIRKMVFLAVKNVKNDDDRWIYLPSMDLVKRLAGSDKRSSFAGSHFVYEDVTGRYPHLDTHELISSDGNVYKIKSTPKNSKGNEFNYYISTIDKTTFLPQTISYHDANGNVFKEYKSEKIETIEGFNTITEFSMTDLNSGESTYTTYSDVRYNVGIEEKIFTESYLKRSPRQWLRYNTK